MTDKVAELDVQGMTCSGCSGLIERTLAAIPGVRNATVDLDGASARVVHAADVKPDALVAAVIETGKTATLKGTADAGAKVPGGAPGATAQKS